MARKQEYSVRTRQCESGRALPLFLWGCLCCTVLLTFGDMGELASFCHTFWVPFSLWSSAVLLVKHQNRSRVHQACVSHGLTTTGGQEDHTDNNQSDALKKLKKEEKQWNPPLFCYVHSLRAWPKFARTCNSNVHLVHHQAFASWLQWL